MMILKESDKKGNLSKTFPSYFIWDLLYCWYNWS